MKAVLGSNTRKQMAYVITFKEKEGGVLTTYTGTVTDGDMINSANERLSLVEKLKWIKYFFSDFTDVDNFKVTSTGIQKIATIATTASKINNELILVAVVPSVLEYGMGRMWQAYSDEINWKTYLARTKEEASEWLNKNL